MSHAERLFYTYSGGWAAKKAETKRAIANGSALQAHIKAAHAGKVDPQCRACREIARKGEQP